MLHNVIQAHERITIYIMYVIYITRNVLLDWIIILYNYVQLYNVIISCNLAIIKYMRQCIKRGHCQDNIKSALIRPR